MGSHHEQVGCTVPERASYGVGQGQGLSPECVATGDLGLYGSGNLGLIFGCVSLCSLKSLHTVYAAFSAMSRSVHRCRDHQVWLRNPLLCRGGAGGSRYGDDFVDSRTTHAPPFVCC